MSQRVEVVSNLRVRKNLPEGSTHGLPTLTFVRTFRSFTKTATGPQSSTTFQIPSRSVQRRSPFGGGFKRLGCDGK